MKKKIINALIVVGSIALAVGISYIGWNIKRLANYKLSYEDLVEKTVREMVKPECLNE